MEKNIESVEQEEKNEESEPSILFWVSSTIVVCIAILYCIIARTWEDILKYSTYVAAVLWVVASLFVIYGTISSLRKGKFDWRQFLLVLLFLAISTSISSIAYYSVAVIVKDFVVWIISPTLSKTSAIIISVLITVVLGLILFYFRLKARAIYGLSEAMVGLLVAVERVVDEPYQIKTPEFYFAILTAAIYLFVRGADNIHQGLTKDPIDPLGIKIYNFLKKKT